MESGRLGARQRVAAYPAVAVRGLPAGASVGRLLADPAFARGLRGEPIISLGPVAFAGHEPAPAPDPLAGFGSRAWIMCRGEALEVLGSVLHPLADSSGPDALKAKPKEVVSASVVKLEFVLTVERADLVRAELAAGRIPPEDPVARYGVITLYGLLHVKEHRDDRNSFIRMHGILTWIPREEIPDDCPPDLRAELEAAADEADAFVAAQASPTLQPQP